MFRQAVTSLSQPFKRSLLSSGLRGRQLASLSLSPTLSSSPSSSARCFAKEASVLYGTNAPYVDAMFESWQTDPSSVHRSWDVYFRSGDYTPPPAPVADYNDHGPSEVPYSPPTLSVAQAKGSGAHPASTASLQQAEDIARVVQLVRGFQVRGHLSATTDPLGIQQDSRTRNASKELQLSSYGFSEEDMERVIDLSALSHMPVTGFLASENMTLRQIYVRLKETYCGNIGFEYMHIPDVDKCSWIRDRIETSQKHQFSTDEKLKILERLTDGDHFERFLAKKYTTAKRFGLEGCEALIPGMKAMIDRSSDQDVENIVFGMPHRGRLNVLGTVVQKPLEQILCEFDPTANPALTAKITAVEGHGDVKYHLGMSHDRKCTNGKKIHLTLMANPSHLEAVNPLVIGKTRAKQFYSKDEDGHKSMGVLLHGDAAFAGQGVVYETLGMGDLPSYTTGGTIHIIVNNQIGFTTDPYKSRSSPYCTDVAKGVSAPIFHVNGDDPEAVCRVFDMAVDYRQQFHKDVVIDIVCFRKYGHNEIDEPSFTQPHMYQVIKKHESTLDIYAKQLVGEGVIKQEQVDATSDKVWAYLDAKFEAAKTYKGSPDDWLQGTWQKLVGQTVDAAPQATGIALDTIKDLGAKLATYPKDFNIHNRLKGIMKKKGEAFENDSGIDWSGGEGLAFASLLNEGIHVRLSGQDVERGTFSHRHAVLHDQKEPDVTHTMLDHLSENQAKLSISNSSLSEFGVLGFELGYSLENPNSLTIWEAQFGDFFNGAQIIFDCFLSSGEEKWLRQSGLVVLLPHGYEGMGPEHSSARMERFLQNSNEDLDIFPNEEEQHKQHQKANWSIVNCTTPANFFHALRRQVHRGFRKPLICFTPKSLLRHPLAKSNLSDFGEDVRFQAVIGEELLEKKNEDIKRVVYCCGKVYYDLLAHRTENKIDDIAIVRLEQLTPFPFQQIKDEQAKYPNADVVFTQEEPKNMGPWYHCQLGLNTALNGAPVSFCGRATSGSTATGSGRVHTEEQVFLLQQTFNLE